MAEIIKQLFTLSFGHAGLICFCISVSVWTMIFYNVFGDKIPVLGYLILAFIMTVAPMFSGTYIKAEQDYMYLGDALTSLCVLISLKAFRKDHIIKWLKRTVVLIFSGIVLVCAQFLDRAFLMVFAGVYLLIYLAVRFTHSKIYTKNLINWFTNMFTLSVSFIVGRTVILRFFAERNIGKRELVFLKDKTYMFLYDFIEKAGYKAQPAEFIYIPIIIAFAVLFILWKYGGLD